MSAQNTWYVSPGGNNKNAGTQHKPFLTIDKAIAVIKSNNATGPADYRIVLRGGTYPVYKTIQVNISLNPKSTLSIEAYPGETPVLSGNKNVNGKWTEIRPNLWKSPVTGYFNQLFVDGQRAVRARFPNDHEWLQPDTIQLTANRLVFNGKIPADFGKIQGAELHSTGYWHWVRQKIDRLDVKNQAVFTKDYPGPACSSTKISRVDRVHFENALSFVDAEGEWFLDSLKKELFVFSSEDPSKRKFEYPVIPTQLMVEGKESVPLQNIRIQGLTLTGTEWNMPAIGREGYSGRLLGYGQRASRVCAGRCPDVQMGSEQRG